ncbi:dipeptidase [Mesorhizobium sp. AR02]|uniref:dipeptidase n=1 Tax=Mesorhizobium sp. AR02 TaxID=2865837 RepID=UPI002160CF8E|nr:dipeptidase [Mesorhizobium sp. AR02]UVK57054.1 dipeptidase [Mesorhizobium sp. AR02]
MPDSGIVLVFDGHNDLLLRLYRRGGPDAARSFIEGDGKGHLDLPRMKEGGMAGGFFAIFAPAIEHARYKAEAEALYAGETYDVPLPPSVPCNVAQAATLNMASRLFAIERESDGQFKIVRNAAELDRCIADGIVAAILHIEGAEAIDPDFHLLEVLHQAGLRSLGPVWSRPNIFGNGVPSRFPSTGDTGDGLTEHGIRLVKECNARRIMIDLSHLNEKGFWDVARLSDAPLVATHSNVHAISPHSRNLTDTQLAAIRETGGMVGVAYAGSFIRPDGRVGADPPLDMLIDHIAYLVDKLGDDKVGMGSDFDGATVPTGIGNAAGLQNLVEAMRLRGFDEPTLEKICHGNWLRVLAKTWGG